MSCAKPKCRTKSDDPMVSCWLCYDIYHAKCVDLAARTADNLREDKGLRWCCKKCISYDVEFYSFFKNSMKEFEEINSDLKNLMKKFNKYKDLLEKSPFSPKKKGSRVAVSSVNNCKNSENCPEVSPLNSPSVPNQIPVNSQTALPFDVSSSRNSAQKLISQPPSSITSNSSLPRMNEPPVTLNVDVPVVAPVTNAPVLRVISPKKTIFAARFASETSTDDISNYIKHKIGSDIDLTVFKFKYTEQRSKSSFKIIVPEEFFDTIVNTDFWPPKAIIHEYIYRNNSQSDIVYLPSISKN